jgi:hypothetical protein
MESADPEGWIGMVSHMGMGAKPTIVIWSKPARNIGLIFILNWA